MAVGWIDINNLELDCLESTTDNKSIVLLDWPVAIFEVWNQVCLA